ncbi:Hsp70 family protein [Allosaccharopolyspora coralli]|uniref:Hsp70 family protein n=1 Tax=Allosaccharopolyspora coralli TaxID=2665642 RepID=A0A5Q3Q9U3_9PSEU|nr:Hsp70 family protein [Allosaccharopolyspora coralli]QGK68369.1 Hsp70 family protein [Allosaccharopolyspora coralli]
MPYVLGIHVGGTVTSAAVARREGGRWGSPAPVGLAAQSPTLPTVLCRVQDGSFVAGHDAERQELHHHEWVVRGFTRAVGDEVPLLVGDDFVAAHELVATMIEWVADLVAHRQGHPPEHVAVAHPATWGPYRAHLVHQALGRLGIGDVTLVPEPVAVGLDYADRQGLDDSDAIAVASLGGTSVDVTVLRRREPGFDVLGSSLSADHLSGAVLDDEVVTFVRSGAGVELDELDTENLRVRSDLFGLRTACVRAKEILSHQPETTVPVELGEHRAQVQLTRSRYEQLARPHLERLPDLLSQAVQSVALQSEDLAAVVLAGGSARTPLLRQLVGQKLSTAPRVDVAPELVAARGAAVSAVTAVSTETDEDSAAEPGVVIERPDELDLAGRLEPPPADDPPEPITRPPVKVEPMHLDPPARNPRVMRMITLSVAAVLIVIGLVLTVMHYQDGGMGWSPSGPGLLSTG